MKYMAILLVMLVVVLAPASVSADELWIENQGGVEVTITGEVTDIQYDGLYAYNPENGKLAAANIETGWIVITGDIEDYEVTLACGQDFEDVNPAVNYVFEYEGTRFSFDPTTSTKEAEIARLDELVVLGFGPPPPPPDYLATAPEESVAEGPVTYKNVDSGPSIEEVVEFDWTGQDYWLYT
jgi:hypothetical protein